ncbi:MAG: HDOD domain-containing protein [Pirellulaceae bacterium]
MTNPSLPANRETLLQRLQDLDSVQPLPASALALLNACQNPNGQVDEVISIIETEPAIAARILAVANSPLYGYSRQITTIGHAVVILGSRNLSRLAASYAALKMFCENESSGKFREQLYRHSLGCASVARNLTQKDDGCDPDQAFLGGVLHDIGKLVMMQLLAADYSQLVGAASPQEILTLEQQAFGISHQEVGEFCARKWGFPAEISAVIGHHHGSSAEPLTTPLSQVVEAANHVALSDGIGGDAMPLDTADYSHNSILANLKPDVREEVVETSREEFQILADAGN